MAIDSSVVRFVRDVVSAAVAGVGIVGFTSWLRYRRMADERHSATEKRLDRHAVEIRHTQQESGVTPFFNGEL